MHLRRATHKLVPSLARGVHKDIKFSNEGRASILKGVDVLANAVSVTLGPKGNFDVQYASSVGTNANVEQEGMSLLNNPSVVRRLQKVCSTLRVDDMSCSHTHSRRCDCRQVNQPQR